IIVSIYGIIDEIHQSFTPGRSSTISDWIADTLGALFGSFVFYLVVKIINKIKDKKSNTK
ncbi:MAG: VanZ family protein, partial [Spirochaetaceae bacterium]|nr:VanZ family protein [Spirochaetaceae bacterium]